jgi:hypothetical protein
MERKIIQNYIKIQCLYQNKVNVFGYLHEVSNTIETYIQLQYSELVN